MLLCLRVDLRLYVILKQASREFEALQRLLPPFKREHIVWAGSPIPHCGSIGWTIGGRVQGWTGNQVLERSPTRVLFGAA